MCPGIVVDEHHEARAIAHLGVSQHLLIADRVAERGDGAPPDDEMDASGLPVLSSFNGSFGTLVKTGLPLLS
jgi:hypothetical protein